MALWYIVLRRLFRPSRYLGGHCKVRTLYQYCKEIAIVEDQTTIRNAVEDPIDKAIEKY